MQEIFNKIFYRHFVVSNQYFDLTGFLFNCLIRSLFLYSFNTSVSATKYAFVWRLEAGGISHPCRRQD